MVHRYKTLKDEDLVPDDSVDNGEQGEVEEVLDAGGLDLSYLWLVNANNLGPRPRSPTSTKKEGTTTTTTSDDDQVRGAKFCRVPRLVRLPNRWNRRGRLVVRVFFRRYSVGSQPVASTAGRTHRLGVLKASCLRCSWMPHPVA